jgi:hypothetical protein
MGAFERYAPRNANRARVFEDPLDDLMLERAEVRSMRERGVEILGGGARGMRAGRPKTRGVPRA